MDDRPVSEERLEIIVSGSSERRFYAMRDQAERGRDFQRRVRWMWLRRDLVASPEVAPVIGMQHSLTITATGAPLEWRQADSA
jgi:hypothetical protein